MDRKQLDQCSREELADAIGQLHGLMAGVHAALLELIAAFDEKQGWSPDGATSTADWLQAALQISRRTATEWVATGRALGELPAILGAYREGRLSEDQVVPAAEVATPETEGAVLAQAESVPVAALQAAARHERLARARAIDPRTRIRSLRWWQEEDWMRFSGRLPAEDGALVAKALEGAVDDHEPDPATGMFEPYAQRCADALVELAATSLGAGGDPARASVVVHVDAGDLVNGTGAADIENAPSVPLAVARRLACDARIEVVAEGSTGPLGVGRARRSVPGWMSRHLRRRDQGCRFPGCGRSRYLHAHHIQHWAQGGPTNLDNLVLLCQRHHRLVHEDGWTLRGSPDGGLRFLRPNGWEFEPGPPPLRAEVGARFESWGLVPADTS